MEFDRFDIVQAHYWFCADYHEGQASEKYAKLSRISGYYKPGAMERGPTNENAKAIYDALAESE